VSGGSLLLAPIDETGAGEDPTYKYVRELDKDADDIESGRLFYVAATRAKQRLHLLACAKATEDLAARDPSKRSLLSKIWWQAREHFGEAPPDAVAEPERMPIRDVLQRLPAGFALPSTPASVKWSAPEEGREESEIEFSWAGETARHVGTVVHRELQRIAQDEMKNWDAARIDALRGRFTTELRRRGVPAAEVKPATERVVTALTNTLTDKRGRWLLGPQGESKTEYRLRVPGGATYIVDRSFRDSEGRLWIVDWKTSRHEGAGLEEFLDEQRKRYEPQLNAYARALGNVAHLGLYFPLLRGWRQWDS
jgi:ATP-dependent exoDNAse (exonuclease V) beta subunit